MSRPLNLRVDELDRFKRFMESASTWVNDPHPLGQYQVLRLLNQGTGRIVPFYTRDNSDVVRVAEQDMFMWRHVELFHEKADMFLDRTTS